MTGDTGPRPPIKQVWFDFAGTLYRETPKFIAVHDALRYETYAQVTGINDMERAKSEFQKAYEQHHSNAAVFVSLGKPKDFWPKTVAEMDFSAVLKPDMDVVNTIAELGKIVPVSLMGGLNRQKAMAVLDLLEIPKELFTHILASDQFPEPKPALGAFRMLIETSGLPAHDSLYIGDRINVDILPAKKVGLQTGLIYSQSDEADYCFDSFPGILSLFNP
jgi:FMN phosphatase YigB (HAD superfamily)